MKNGNNHSQMWPTKAELRNFRMLRDKLRLVYWRRQKKTGYETENDWKQQTNISLLSQTSIVNVNHIGRHLNHVFFPRFNKKKNIQILYFRKQTTCYQKQCLFMLIIVAVIVDLRVRKYTNIVPFGHYHITYTKSHRTICIRSWIIWKMFKCTEGSLKPERGKKIINRFLFKCLSFSSFLSILHVWMRPLERAN